MPSGYRRRLESFRHAPGIFKIDYALSEADPVESGSLSVAQAQFISGQHDEIAAANARLQRGKIPERPFVSGRATKFVR
jgi:hypothetical protein